MNASPSVMPTRHWTILARAKDGAPFFIRPLEKADRIREVEFLNSLSDQTRYLRLSTPLKYLPPHLIDQLMSVEGERFMAFVATKIVNGRETFVGVARYGVANDPHTVELGITVIDAWQRQGIGTQLIAQLCRYAKSRGYTRMVGSILAQNAGMLRLAHRLGFKSRVGEQGILEIELDLGSST
jgi:acetyltransferase